MYEPQYKISSSFLKVELPCRAAQAGNCPKPFDRERGGAEVQPALWSHGSGPLWETGCLSTNLHKGATEASGAFLKMVLVADTEI